VIHLLVADDKAVAMVIVMSSSVVAFLVTHTMTSPLDSLTVISGVSKSMATTAKYP